MKVLVADDDAGSLLVAKAVVESFGHECVTAPDGDIAWRCFQSFRPDVLLTDREMPGLNGTQLTRAVRSGESDTYTYVILVTGASDRADVLSGMEAGADDYLIKPLDPFVLQARLLAAERVTRLHSELGQIRKQLSAQTRTDPLTGLRNRLGMQDALHRLHSTSERYRHQYGLALCDVDQFKRYNDTYGHQVGDDALRAVATTLVGGVRTGDEVYRYGGEEFLVLLPEQDQPGSLIALDRIRGAVEGLAIAHAGAGPGRVLTLSVGVSSFSPDRPVSSDEMLIAADQALYRSKEDGRNRVTHAASPASVLATRERG